MRFFNQLLISALFFAMAGGALAIGSKPSVNEKAPVNAVSQARQQLKAIEDSKAPKTKGTKYYNRLIWEAQNGLLDRGYIPEINTDKERKAPRLNTSGWQPMGPDLLAVSYDTLSGHGIGRINCVEFHPTDPDIMWAGAPNGGVWKTDNCGQTWRPLTDFLSVIQISDIEVNPHNPDELYISIGDFDKINWVVSNAALGVIKSTDGGESWVPTGLSYASSTFNYSYIRKVIVNEENPNKLIAGGSAGLWTSEDAGENWTMIVDSFMVADLQQSPDDPNVLYAGLGNFYGYFGNAGIAKTTDFGQHWTVLDTDIPPAQFVSRAKVAISPANSDIVYAVTADMQTRGMYSVLKTTNGGQDWETIFDVMNDYNLLGWYEGSNEDLNRGQGTYDLTIQCGRDDPNKVYVGGVFLWGSEDGGESWGPVSYWTRAFGSSMHADQHNCAYNSVDGYYYYCNDGGLYRTKEIIPGQRSWITDCIDKTTDEMIDGCPSYDLETEWEFMSEGMQTTEFYRLGLSRGHSGYISGGCQDNSGFYYNGEEWRNFITSYDGFETMISHQDPNVVYGSAQYGLLFRSLDGCKTYDKTITDTIRINHGEQGDWLTPFAMDPVDDNILYAGFRNLWRTTDAGDTWQKLFDLDQVSSHSSNVSKIVIAPSDRNVIMIAKPNRNNEAGGRHELWITMDGGENWDQMIDGLPCDSIAATSFCFHADDPNTMWLSFQTTLSEFMVMKTTNGGQSWQSIRKDMPNILVYSLVQEEGSSHNTIYAGTNYGVWSTNDTLQFWQFLEENLPHTTAIELEIDYDSRKLYAATYGRGIWAMDLLNPVDVKDNSLHSADMDIYPNPSRGSFTLKLGSKMSNSAAVTIDILDIFGRSVYSTDAVPGSGELTMNIECGLPSGQYYVKVSNGNTMKVESLIIKK